MESSIKEQEDQYKSLQQEIEKNENILQSLSEEMMDDSGPRSRPTQMDALKAKLSEQQELNKKLKRQLKEIEDQKVCGNPLLFNIFVRKLAITFRVRFPDM